MNDQRELVERHFDGFSASWADLYTGGVPFQRYNFLIRRQQVLTLLGQPGGRVLDVGCGSGDYIPSLLEVADEVVGVDSVPAMIDKAARLRDELPEPDRVQLAVGDVTQLDYPDQHFDAIIGVGLVEYMDSVTPVFAELCRVLRPGGTLVLTFPNILSPFMVYETFTTWARRQARSVRARLGGPEVEPRYVHHHFLPAAIDRQLARAGLIKVDAMYCTFGVYSAGRLSPFYLWLSRKLERFARSPLGLLATNYNVRLTRS